MAEFVISLIVAVLGLLGFGIYKTHKLEDQKIKTQEAEAMAEVARKQMEVVHEVRKELKVVEEEKPPEKVEAPISGDSDSRLDRLNKLHQH